MTALNTSLTANELKAAMVLVTKCLGGMGGSRPADLGGDEYTWVDAKMLMAHGWNKNEAAGTFGALMEKGWVSEYDKKEWVLETEAWQHLDTLWDAYHAPVAETATEEAPAEYAALTNREMIQQVWKPGKIRMPVYHKHGIEYITVEKADLERTLRAGDLDSTCVWQFLPVSEGDTERYLDSRQDD